MYIDNCMYIIGQLQDIRIVTSAYDKLVHDAATLGGYGEMAHLYALSAAICMPIASYCPSASAYASIVLGNAYTTTVYGRGASRSSHPSVTIMWTMTAQPSSRKNFEVNHYVYLVKIPESNYSSEDLDDEDDDVEPIFLESHNDEGEADEPVVCDEHKCDEDQHDEFEVEQIVEGIPCNGNMPGGKFMEPEAVLKLLQDDKTPFFPRIPKGLKQQTFFAIANDSNVLRVKNVYPDDCGVWNSLAGSTHNCLYIIEEKGTLKVTFL
jgi:hypothetical protein